MGIFGSPKSICSMNNTKLMDPRAGYVAPSVRVVETKQELTFLASNLEPIGGGDDPDIDW